MVIGRATRALDHVLRRVRTFSGTFPSESQVRSQAKNVRTININLRCTIATYLEMICIVNLVILSFPIIITTHSPDIIYHHPELVMSIPPVVEE